MHSKTVFYTLQIYRRATVFDKSNSKLNVRTLWNLRVHHKFRHRCCSENCEHRTSFELCKVCQDYVKRCIWMKKKSNTCESMNAFADRVKELAESITQKKTRSKMNRDKKCWKRFRGINIPRSSFLLAQFSFSLINYNSFPIRYNQCAERIIWTEHMHTRKRSSKGVVRPNGLWLCDSIQNTYFVECVRLTLWAYERETYELWWSETRNRRTAKHDESNG